MNATVNEKHLVQSRFREKFAFLYDKHSLFYYVILLIVVGLGFFAYALVYEKFTTPFGGDFAQQYMSFEYGFYDDWWTFFKTGHFPLYSTNTFLGADNIISNTYYGLFSPFTLPILFFPRSFVPHAMALMTIAKLVTGALLFRVYLKYMGASEKSARIFALAYAFMGWTAFYLWFNNFTDVLAFFPLILFGIEKIIRQKQIWACSLGFFLMALGNYFFLLTFGIFGVIYAGFRFFQTIKERGGWKNWKDHLAVLGLGIAGFALGYLASAVVLFPAILGNMGISRSNLSQLYFDALKNALKEGDHGKFFDIIFTYWNPGIIEYGNDPEKYYFCFAFPVASYFYPTLSCRYVNIIGCSTFDDAGGSLFFFTPCIIMFGGCLYRSIIHKKFSHFIAIAISIFVLFVPFFYFLSGAFMDNYARWQIVIPTMGLVYMALNFDHREEIPRLVILISGIVAFACMIGTYFLACNLIDKYGYVKGERESFYLYSLYDDDQIAVVFYETILCAIETFIIAGFWKKKYLNTIVNLFIIGEAIVMGTVVANMHGLQDIESDVNTGLEQLSYQVALIDKIEKEDSSFFRMYSSVADESHVNMPQASGYNGMTTFHTFYNNQVDDFARMTNMLCWEKSWSSHYLFKHQYLESFLGVKYYLTRDTDTKYYGQTNLIEADDFATIYEDEGKEYILVDEKIFNIKDCSASGDKITIAANGYIQNVEGLELQTISFVSESLTVYGAKDLTSPFEEVEKYEGEYELYDYRYFRIVNNNSSSVSIEDITIKSNTVYNPNVPLNYSLYDQDLEHGYRIYKNEHHIEFGIAYDSLYYKHRLESNPRHNQFYMGANLEAALRNEEVLFKGAILNDEDIEEIKKDYNDSFAFYDRAPSLLMNKVEIEEKGTYAPYKEVDGKKVYDIYLNPEEPTKYIQDEYLVKDKDVPVNSYQIVYVPKDGSPTFPCGSEGSYFMLDYPVRTGTNYNTCVWLIDEYGKTITFDEARYTNSDIGHVGRALYSKKPVSKIILCPLGYEPKVAWEQPSLYYLPYEDVLAVIDKAKDNGIKNLKRDVDTFTFETNYENEKFFVTQLAYTGDNSWKLQATDENGKVTYPKIYNAQGGFAGFIAPKGKITYKLTYKTPDFYKWAAVSVAAFLGAGALTVAPFVIRKRKEKRDKSLDSN